MYEVIISPCGHDNSKYGVATISRLPKNISLFCKRALYKSRVNMSIWRRCLYGVIISPCGHDNSKYGIAVISRLLKIIGLFCKRAQ